MSEYNSMDKAPDFCLPDSEGQEICLEQFRGSWVVLYFYPKDNTSGCTLEAIDFSAKIADFSDLGAVIVGISPDSPKSHCNFIEKHDLKVRLLSDADHTVIEQYQAWILKKMYGREYYGVGRSTFIIDPDGRIAYLWRQVKVKGHIEEVYTKLSELQK